MNTRNTTRKHTDEYRESRRKALATCAGAALLCLVPARAALAATGTRVLTPPQSRGPFYPVTLPLDKDNDLLQVEGRPGLAEGTPLDLRGRVIDERGRALSRVRLEIWQCNAFGRYHHPWDRRGVPIDENFQGYGTFETGGDGAYRFRTIKPVPYPGRAPHIHFAVSGPGFETLVTQMYVEGEPRNARDGILNAVRDRRARQSLIVSLEPHPEVPGTLTGRFELVLAADGRHERAAPRTLEGLRRSV